MKPLLTLCVVFCLAGTALPAQPDSTLGVLVRTLSNIENPETQANILRGMNASLEGKQGITAPEEWDAVYDKLMQSPDEEVRRQALALAATLGGKGALDRLRQTLADGEAPAEARKFALGSLLAARDAATLPLLSELIAKPGPLRAPALRGLAGYDDPGIPAAIIAIFTELEVAERPDALNTLVGRRAGARALLVAIDAEKIPATEISAPLAAQLRGLGDLEIDAWVERNWGSVRSSSADKQQEIENHKKFLGTDAILAADARKGRLHYLQRCAACHTLHGEGQKIGPELPGSYKDLDYLLQNILDPNAVIGKDYQQTLVRTKDGQVLSGVITGDEESAVTLRTLVGASTVQRRDIESIETLEHSLMPEGLLTGLQEEDIRDLFLYLRLSEPLPAEE